MAFVPLKIGREKIIGTSIGAFVSALTCYFVTKDWKFTIFISTTVMLFEFASFVYYSCHRNYSNNPRSTQPTTLDGRHIAKESKETTYRRSSFKKDNKRIWFKFFILVSLAVFSKAITSKWIVPMAICVNYLLWESYQYCNRIYKKLFPSNNIVLDLLLKKSLKTSKDWSRRKIIIVALCIDMIEIFLFCSLFFITLGIVVRCIFQEIHHYYREMTISGNATAMLIQKILSYATQNGEIYPEYFFTIVATIFIKILPHYM